MEEYVEVSGARLWSVRTGRGPAMVLLHGGPGGSFSGLRTVAAMLDDLGAVHGYDQRASGRSTGGPPFTVARWVADLDGLRAHWGLESWIVAGHSFHPARGAGPAPRGVGHMPWLEAPDSLRAFVAGLDVLGTGSPRGVTGGADGAGATRVAADRAGGVEWAAMSATATSARPAKMRALRAVVVATLVILAVQGWFGDTVTIFISPANGITPPAPGLDGFLHELQVLPAPLFPIWHALQGLVLVFLAVAVLVLSFACSRSRGVRVWAVVGLLTMLNAALGGYLFVKSGLADGGSSAQMGFSFIGTFASYFLVLYYTK